MCTGSALEIRANVVVNAAGPWVDQILNLLEGRHPDQPLPLSKAMNLVVNRPLVRGHAVGIYSKRTFRDDDALIRRGSRLFFVTPWRHLSLIGTAHLPYHGAPDAFVVTEEDIQDFLDEINEAYPALAVKREEVVTVHRGLLPMDGINSATGDVKLAKQYRVRDHSQEEGIDGLISVIGVKYTTARYVAQRTVDLVFRKLGQKSPRSRTATTAVYGGDIEQLSAFVKGETAKYARVLDAKTMQHLIYNYGTAYPEVLQCVKESPSLYQPLTPYSPVIKAEIVHAVRDEMALRLSDVVLRRTDLGLAGNPGDCCLSVCAEIMAAELGWGDIRKRREITETRAIFSSLGAVRDQGIARAEEQRVAL
jgi:glycerol-3-phosphate dehydrogenase